MLRLKFDTVQPFLAISCWWTIFVIEFWILILANLRSQAILESFLYRTCCCTLVWYIHFLAIGIFVIGFWILIGELALLASVHSLNDNSTTHFNSKHTIIMARDDAVDEENIVLCCALGCINCGCYKDADCLGCSGKIGLCCLNLQMCCKPSAPCLPCGCIGPRLENDGCSVFNIQCQLCSAVISGAIPCNKEVPVALTVLGLTIFPKVGCCVKIGDIQGKGGDYVNSNEMERA